jgi:nucleoside-diphosphate-sugar epimerase
MSYKVLRIAILGATSEIAMDLIQSFLENSKYQLTLFGRRPNAIIDLASSRGFSGLYDVKYLEEFNVNQKYDVLINFIGVGDPVKAVILGASILEVTYKYDDLAIEYLKQHPHCRYIFLSSGAVYGSDFSIPASEKSNSVIPVNEIQSQNWYGIAKLYAECRHRALPDLGIVDLRVFNYFSHTQDMNARYLMTDICRAISGDSILITSPNEVMRDFISSVDFYNLITCILASPKYNIAIDCYSLCPLKKSDLLLEMKARFGLRYEIGSENNYVNVTGGKSFYFSINKRAHNLGYKPKKTSLNTVSDEVEMYLKKRNQKNKS